MAGRRKQKSPVLEVVEEVSFADLQNCKSINCILVIHYHDSSELTFSWTYFSFYCCNFTNKCTSVNESSRIYNRYVEYLSNLFATHSHLEITNSILPFIHHFHKFTCKPITILQDVFGEMTENHKDNNFTKLSDRRPIKPMSDGDIKRFFHLSDSGCKSHRCGRRETFYIKRDPLILGQFLRLFNKKSRFLLTF